MKYNENTASIELSVRELCAMAFSGGDLEFGGSRGIFSRMQEGSRIHRRLQENRGIRYAAEVPLSNTTYFGDLCYHVSGRADGVETEEDGTVTVEEIKSMHARAMAFPVPPAYLAQLWVYGYFVCKEKNIRSVRLRMVRFNIDTEETKESEEVQDVDTLFSNYTALLEKINRWAMLLREHTVEDLPTLASLPFPYPGMRLGQEEMIRRVYHTVNKGGKLFVQAPTGIGKTASTLYPCIRARGRSQEVETAPDRVFYLTAKASTRAEALGAVKRMNECGAKLRTVVLTAREQICCCPALGGGEGGVHCNGIECPYAAGYFDRSGEAVWDVLHRGWSYDRACIEDAARYYQVCPYELSLDVSEHCDVIIGDYNYVFDPIVSLRRYFGPGASPQLQGNTVFLIDEAHNLVDRARDMFSSALSCCAFEQVYAKVHPQDKTLNEALETVIRGMRKLKRLCKDTLSTDESGNESGYSLSPTPAGEVNERLAWFDGVVRDWLHLHGEEEIAPVVRRLSGTVREYLCILEHYDEHYVTYVEVGNGDVQLRLLCLDPSGELKALLARAHASILFSATLTPLDYFRDVLGGEKGDRTLSLPSPYDKANFGLFAMQNISTRYQTRADSVPAIAQTIAAAISGKAGNYIVYFPSYSYLETVWRMFHAMYPGITTIVQKKGMRAAEKETFLDAFPADTGKMRVGFCVLGGSFSEGVDLPGSRLIGSIVVGVGLPGLSNERNILQEYYQNKNECGREYAYIYPGMNRVLQAAGRVIRREEDRGIVVLIDDRYATPPYPSLFPLHWSHIQFAGNPKRLAEKVKAFWEDAQK